MSAQDKIDYVEFGAKSLPQTKAFFAEVFGWSFEDYGPNYTAFANAGIDGGFFQSEITADQSAGSVLVVLYSKDIAATEKKISEAGGIITRAIFDFPGGRRFHFREPGGNELAVWTDVKE